MPRFLILHFSGPAMSRLPKNLNQKLGFSGKKISSNVKISNLLGTNHTRFEKVCLISLFLITVILGERKTTSSQQEGKKVPVPHLPYQSKPAVEFGSSNPLKNLKNHQNYQKNRQNCQKKENNLLQHLHLQ